LRLKLFEGRVKGKSLNCLRRKKKWCLERFGGRKKALSQMSEALEGKMNFKLGQGKDIETGRGTQKRKNA